MAINLDVHGNTQPLEAAVQSAVNRIRRQPIKIAVDDKGATQPLGNMKRAADEFSKSMEAANARIIAFGASMAIINGMADAFKGMVRNMVEVEKSLADINVVMGLSTQKLDAFSDGLFKVAKETGAAFKVAADAATEYARQGLNVEESLKRTKDALILTRLTGMDSAEAVKSLTAAMNTYGNQIKDTTQLVSKFAAVDVKFAVSAEDFADAISRTGAAAKGAGVNIDELIGLVTAAQQQTARGGKVIGNSFKTIFTRIGRTDTLNQLENLGIAVRDIEGKTLGAKKILTDLANTFDSLSEAQKAQIAQTVGGVFQINVLKAVLGDAAKQNGILANATQISAGATNEAIEKNEQLRNTMAAMATETGLAIKQVSAQIGEIMLAPGIEKVLNIVKSGAEGLSGILGDGEGTGNKFANGFLKGLGNVISGPGLVIITAVFGKLFLKAASFAKESLTSLIGVTSEAQKQKAIQTSLVGLFGRSSELSKEMLRTDISRTEKEKIILGLLRAQVAEAKMLDSVAKSSAATLYSKGFGANLTPRRGRAYGHIPNFANPEREQAARGGYAAGSIRSMDMPGEGSVIYNSAEKVKTFSGLSQPAIMPPLSSKAGKNYQQAFGSVHGFDPYAAKGFVPNFNKANPRANEKFAHQRQLKNINLSKHAKNLAILFGYGGEGIEKNSYSQSFTSMGPAKYSNVIGHNASANSSLTRYVSKKYPNIRKLYGNNLEKLHSSLYSQNPNVSVSLPSKAIMPISSSEVLSAKKMDELGDQKLKGIVRPPLDSAMKSIAQGIGHSFLVGAGVGIDDKISSIFTENSKGTKANDIIGALAEMGVRGALSAVAEKTGSGEGGQAGAAFDFTGGHAKKISEFFGKGYAFDAVEMKLRGSTAVGKDGGIPKKVINRLMAARGYIPNFANPLSDAIGRERDAGVPVSQIRVGTHPALMNKGNPIGLGVTNTKDEPNGLKDVFGAKGYVPNYASSFLSDFGAGRDEYKSAAELQKELNVENKKLLKEQKELNQLKKSGKDVNKRLQGVEKQLTRNLQDQAYASKMAAESTKKMGIAARAGGLTQKAINANQAFSNSPVGRGLSGFGGMGLMMGAPLVAGFLQEGRQGETEQERITRMGGASYSAGGFLSGAGMGASMGMMFGPLGAAVGALAGGFMGLVNTSKELEEAQKDLADKQSQRFANDLFGASNGQSFLFESFQKKAMSAEEVFSAGNIRKMISKEKSLRGNKLSRQESFSIDALEKVAEYAESGKLVRRNQPQGALESMFKGKRALDFLTGQDLENIVGYTGQAGTDETKYVAKAQLQRQIAISAMSNLESDQSFRTASGDKISRNDYIKKLQELDPQNEKQRDALAKEFNSIKMKLEEEEDLRDKKNQGIILQLNAQRAIATAQQEARKVQFNIKSSYAELDSSLSLQAKIMGNFTTEQQKAQLDYTKAIIKASESYAAGAALEQGKYRQGMLAFSKNDNIASALKTSLAKKELEKEAGLLGANFLEEGKIKERAAQIDLTQKLVKLSNEELYIELKKANLNDEQLQTLEDFRNSKEKNVEMLLKELGLSTKIAENEFKINDAIAKRKDLLANMSGAIGMSDKQLAHDQKMRGFASQLAAAQRLTAVGPGYQTRAEQEDFQMREKRITLGETAKTLRENATSAINKKIQERTDLELQQQLTKEQIATSLNPFEQNELQQTLEKQQQALAFIDHEINNINESTEQEISNAKKLLAEEEKRLAAKRAHETGPDAFKNGFKDTGGKMLEQTETLNYQLGTVTATHFRDGLVTAMDAAIDSSKDLGDALQGVAMGFLQAMQNAFLTSAANTVVGAIGLSSGGNVRNYSRGGAVPAMVSDGEYVMNRRAVNKYGSNFMHQINARGKAPKYNSGGSVNSLESFFSPQPQFSILPPRSFKDRMMDFFQNEKNMKLFQQEYQKAQLKNLQQSTIKKTSLAEAFSSPIKSGSQMGLAEAFSSPIKTGSASSAPEFPVNQNADIFAETRKSLIKQKDFEIKNARTSLEIPKIEAKYNYLIDKINNPKVNPFDYATPNKWWQKGSPNYLLPDFIKNKPIDTSYKSYGFGSYGVGAVKRFSAGGPAPGSALAANFGPGKGVDSGRAYQSMPMSGFFYSGQAESVAIQEDVDSMNEILREEKKRKMEALQKKMKKKALKNQLLGTALSAGLSFGINAAFEGGLFGGGGGDKMGLGADTINRMPESAFNFDAPTQYNSMTSRLGFDPFQIDPFSNGGSVNKYASGGMIHGKSGIDQIPAMLSEGEYVIKANSVRQMGKPLLDKINAGKFYDGGLVGDSSSGSQESSSSSTNNINITLNLDKSGKKSEEQSQDGDDGSKDQRERMKEFTEKIKMQVLSVIVEEQKPGGLLQDTK